MSMQRKQLLEWQKGAPKHWSSLDSLRIHVQSMEIIGFKDGFNSILMKISAELNSSKSAQSDAKEDSVRSLDLFAKSIILMTPPCALKMRAISMRSRSCKTGKCPCSCLLEYATGQVHGSHWSLDTALENSGTEQTLLIKQAIAKALDFGPMPS